MRFETTVAGTPAEVFPRVADFARLAEWDPAARTSVVESGEPLQEGSIYRLEASLLGGGFTLHYVLHQVDAPRLAVYTGGTRRVSSVDRVECLPVGDGTTVRITSNLSFGGWTLLISPFVRAALCVGGRLMTLPALRRHLGAGGRTAEP